jgi:hypothetical protein
MIVGMLARESADKVWCRLSGVDVPVKALVRDLEVSVGSGVGAMSPLGIRFRLLSPWTTSWQYSDGWGPPFGRS